MAVVLVYITFSVSPLSLLHPLRFFPSCNIFLPCLWLQSRKKMMVNLFHTCCRVTIKSIKRIILIITKDMPTTFLNVLITNKSLSLLSMPAGWRTCGITMFACLVSRLILLMMYQPVWGYHGQWWLRWRLTFIKCLLCSSLSMMSLSLPSALCAVSLAWFIAEETAPRK